MHLLIGQAALDGKDHQQALTSFVSAGELAPLPKLPELETISLVCSLPEWFFRSSQFSLDIWLEFRLVVTRRPSTDVRNIVRSVPSNRGSTVFPNSVGRVWNTIEGESHT